MSTFTAQIIRDHAELADALANLKNFRGLSNEEVEELVGLSRGHCDKILGPSREKSIGKSTLAALLLALAGRLVLERDLDQEKLMQSRWTRRNTSQVRSNPHPVSIAVVRAVTPIIFAQLSRKAALARLTKISQTERSRIAKVAAKARWKNQQQRSR